MRLLPRCLAFAAFQAVLVSAAGPALADLGDCGQPITTGVEQTASDCLFILRAGVGSFICDPQCVCDTNAVDLVTASDALLCLRNAVGQDAPMMCDCHVCGFFINSTFHYPVTASLENGWSFESTSGSGWQQNGGNPGAMFFLNESGQLLSDPAVRQTVHGLVVGHVYRVSGDYRSFAPVFGNPLKPDAFVVTVEPKPNDHESVVVLALPRPTPIDTEWSPFSVTFEASADTATVSFIAERDGDDSSFEVDNLCLTEDVVLSAAARSAHVAGMPSALSEHMPVE
ncbi:MAG: hypothetical protein ABR587_02635 [Candidatus Binatia bacterium]